MNRIERGRFGLGVVLATATAALAIAGCSASHDAGSLPPREVTASTGQAIVQGIPDCNKPGTDHSKFQAIPHDASYTGPGSCAYGGPAACYWGPTGWPQPWSASPLDAKQYELNLWNNFGQSNGYVYSVKLLYTSVSSSKAQAKVGHIFLGTGIEAAGLGYYMSPPTSPPLPPAGLTIYSPTSWDFNSEMAGITSAPGTDPGVEADAWSCATILDQTGKVIDFFALFDTHDPSNPPWRTLD